MKKQVFLMVTMMMLLSAVTFGQNARKYYKAGVEFVESFKYEDAITQFTSAIGLEPSNPDYYVARGQAYDNLFKYDDAKADFEKALVFEPKNIDAVIALGADMNKTNKFEEALRLLNYASGLDKRNDKDIS